MDLDNSELYWTRKQKGLVTEKETEKHIKKLEKKIKELETLKAKHNVRINDLCAMVDNFAYDSIPKSLVREKIEELEKGRDTIETFEPTGEEYQVHIINNEAIELLEELLQEGDK